MVGGVSGTDPILAMKRLERLAYKAGYHHVYVVAEGDKRTGPCKIGVADRPHHRMSGMQTGTPRLLKLVQYWRTPGPPASLRVERAAHLILAEYKIRGEWFSVGQKRACKAVESALQDEGVHVVDDKRLMADTGYGPDGLAVMET